MIERKKKLRIIQFSLLIFGLLIIYLTYYNKEIDNTYQSDSEPSKTTVENDDDVFFNIEYTGLDLHGNRYLLKSREARLDESNPEIVYMKDVNAVFYFKDNTTLYIWSDDLQIASIC